MRSINHGLEISWGREPELVSLTLALSPVRGCRLNKTQLDLEGP